MLSLLLGSFVFQSRQFLKMKRYYNHLYSIVKEVQYFDLIISRITYPTYYSDRILLVHFKKSPTSPGHSLRNTIYTIRHLYFIAWKVRF